MSVAKGMAEIAKLITPAIKKALGRGATKQSKAALTRAANKAGMSTKEFKGIAKKILKDKVKPGKKPKYPSLESLGKPKAKNPRPAKPTGKLSREVGRLKRQQEADDAGMARTKGQRELMTKEQYLESNPLEKKAGAGSGPLVSGQIMRGKAMTRDQLKEVEDMAKAADAAKELQEENKKLIKRIHDLENQKGTLKEVDDRMIFASELDKKG